MLFEDETDVLLFPPIRARWKKRGKPYQVWLSGRNAKRVIFGAINAKTGRRHFLKRFKQRSEDFQAFLSQVKRDYPHKPIAILIDTDSSHIAKASQNLARDFKVKLIWLPVRSPELNAMEPLWGDAKDMVCANRQYPDVDNEADLVIKYLKRLPNEVALRKAGLSSRRFWVSKYFWRPA